MSPMAGEPTSTGPGRDPAGREDGGVPSLVPPHLPAGSIASRTQPVIAAGALVLRPFETGDAEWLVEVHRDPDIQRWHLRRFDSTDEAVGWIDAGHRSWATETDANWLVAVAESGERVG